jgi:maltooligosyltrehalose synthase
VSLSASGRNADHIVAFNWRAEGESPPSERRAASGNVITIVPRWLLKLDERSKTENIQPHGPMGEAVWGDTSIALSQPSPTTLTNVLTAEVLELPDARLPVSQALHSFPVGVWTDLPLN